MSAVDILERLHRDGLRVRTDGRKVILAPREKVTADVLELVRANKPAILQRLEALGLRRSRVERELLDHPEQRIAVDVADAPLRPEPGEPVSVLVAVRTAMGIVSGELHIPRERFDAALFLATLEETSRRPQ